MQFPWDLDPSKAELVMDLRYNPKLEGFWGSLNSPVPYDGDWGREEFLQKLIEVEKSCKTLLAFAGHSWCRLCSLENNGSQEYHLGGWAWPSGFKHYISEHNVKPSNEFLAFIRGRTG